jgi:hypothetical protein
LLGSQADFEAVFLDNCPQAGANAALGVEILDAAAEDARTPIICQRPGDATPGNRCPYMRGTLAGELENSESDFGMLGRW